MEIRCVCDTCIYGIPSIQSCYKGGIEKCLKHGEYSLYQNKLKEEFKNLIKDGQNETR